MIRNRRCLGRCAGARRPNIVRQRAWRLGRSRPRKRAISISSALSSLVIASARLAGLGSAADAVDRRAVLALALVENEALVAEASQGRTGGVGQPSRRGNQLIE